MKFLWAQFRAIPGKFFIVIILPWVLVSLLKMLPMATEKIGQSFLGTLPTSYVNLICSDAELAKFLQVRVKALPLIGKIEEYAIANMQSTISKTLNDLEISSYDHDGLKKMVGLKIFFDQQVSEKEFELIKAHLDRLTATMGNNQEIIWGSFVQAKRSQSYAEYLDWVLYGMAFIIVYLIWLVNFFPVKHQLLQSIYLVERYQRRSRTYPKVVILFILLNIFLGSQLISKKMLAGELTSFRSDFMPIFFFCAFILCTAIATLDLQRPWKKA